jgi:hypothetical protein
MAAAVLEGASLRASATATRTPQNGSVPMCLLLLSLVVVGVVVVVVGL